MCCRLHFDHNSFLPGAKNAGGMLHNHKWQQRIELHPHKRQATHSTQSLCEHRVLRKCPLVPQQIYTYMVYFYGIPTPPGKHILVTLCCFSSYFKTSAHCDGSLWTNTCPNSPSHTQCAWVWSQCSANHSTQGLIAFYCIEIASLDWLVLPAVGLCTIGNESGLSSVALVWSYWLLFRADWLWWFMQ